MKSIIILIAFVNTILFSSFTAQAQDDQWPSITISSLVANKYLGFGTGSLLSKKPAVQSDLNIAFKNGLFIDLWNSRSLKGSWNDGSFGNEVDYQVGWRGAVATNFCLDIGVTYFDEPMAFSFGACDILYTHAFLTRDFKHLSVTMGYENYTAMPDSGFRGGNLLSLGVSRHESFCNDKFSLRASVTGVYDTGTIGTRPGFILRGGAGADWNIAKHFSLNVLGVNWYAPLTPHDKRVVDVVFSSGFTLHL
jgi:hypothetical protein